MIIRKVHSFQIEELLSRCFYYIRENKEREREQEKGVAFLFYDDGSRSQMELNRKTFF